VGQDLRDDDTGGGGCGARGGCGCVRALRVCRICAARDAAKWRRSLRLRRRPRALCRPFIRHATQQECDSILAEFCAGCIAGGSSATLPGSLCPAGLKCSQSCARALSHRIRPPVSSLKVPVSGTGVPCDWTRARAFAQRTQLVWRAGLNARNVAAAIREVRPFGVDVSTGVEEKPGIKSALEIVRFVQAAREERKL